MTENVVSAPPTPLPEGPHWERRLEIDAIRETQDRTLTSRLTLWVVNLGLELTGKRAVGEQNALDFTLAEVELAFPNLPDKFDGFTILHLSDFHFDGRPGFLENLKALVGSLDADLCLMTGDYRFLHHGPCDLARDCMAELLEHIHAPHGVIGILGNHDPGQMHLELQELGIDMLFNAHTEVRHEDESLWVLGVDDPHHYGTWDLARAEAGVPEDAFKILLAHTPELYREAHERGVDLYLAGHTHGGQICLPWVGAVRMNTRCPRRLCLGPWRYRDLQGYTTAGIGATDIPVRFNCPPEVALLRLRNGGT